MLPRRSTTDLTRRAMRGGTTPGHGARMNTAKDVILCAIVAAYLFMALALDLRLLVLPSIVAMVGAAAGALARRHDVEGWPS